MRNLTVKSLEGGYSLKEHQNYLKLILDEFDRICKALNIPYMLFAGSMLGAVRHQGFIPWDDDIDVIMMRSDYDRFLAEAATVMDSEKFFLQKEFSEHWPMFFSKLRLNNTTCIEKYYPKDEDSHLGIYIDIFPCDNAFKNDSGRKLQFLASKIVIAKSLYKRGYVTDSITKKVFMAICRFLPAKPFINIVKGGKKNSDCVHSFFAAARNYSKNVFPRDYMADTIQFKFEDKFYPVSSQYDKLLQIIYGDYMTLPSEDKRKTKQHVILIDTDKSYEYYREYHKSLKFDILTRSER